MALVLCALFLAFCIKQAHKVGDESLGGLTEIENEAIDKLLHHYSVPDPF